MENNKYKNQITLTGYVNNVKTFGRLLTFSLSVGVRQQNGLYKNGFMNCKASIDKTSVKKGEKVTIEGFISFDFWKNNDFENERQNPIVVVQKIESLKKPKPKTDEENGYQNNIDYDEIDPETIPF